MSEDRYVTYSAEGYRLHVGEWSRPITSEQASAEERRGTPMDRKPEPGEYGYEEPATNA